MSLFMLLLCLFKMNSDNDDSDDDFLEDPLLNVNEHTLRIINFTTDDLFTGTGDYLAKRETLGNIFSIGHWRRL
jgi:hypothetical protein